MALDDKIYIDIYNYLNDDLSGDELIAFEKTLSSNVELQDSVSVLKKMETIYSPEDWFIFDGDTSKLKEAVAKFRNEDVLEFSEKLRHSKVEYKQKSKPSVKRILIYVSSIAAVGILMFSGYFFKAQESSLDLYQQYYTVDDLPSFVSKNDNLNTVAKAELLFKEKKYGDALILFKSIKENSSETQPNLLIYLALTEAELNNYDVAINHLSELEKSNTIDHHKSYWFKSLVYLKQGNKEKALVNLNYIAKNEDYFNYEDAISLLKKLE